jgi:hypothetical protein
MDTPVINVTIKGEKMVMNELEAERLSFPDKTPEGISWSEDLDGNNSMLFVAAQQLSKWEVYFAGWWSTPGENDLIPNAFQRFMQRWLLGIIWRKRTTNVK